MEIKLDQKYWLVSDLNQYMICEKVEGKSKEGKEYSNYKPKAYLTTLQKALNCYCELSLRESKARSWEEVLSETSAIKKRLDEISARLNAASSIDPENAKEVDQDGD